MLPEKTFKDRRIQKTQGLLHQALISLLTEKPYDTIAVKEILDRANVGRSTFYMHFRDKDELFVSGIHEMLRVAREETRSSRDWPENIIWFSLHIFEDIHRHWRKQAVSMGPKGRAFLQEPLQHVLLEWISEDVAKEFTSREKTEGSVSPDLLCQFVVSTFLTVLGWWVESRSPLAPKDANELFRSLVLPILRARPR